MACGNGNERREKVYLVECERSGPHLEIPYLFLLTQKGAYKRGHCCSVESAYRLLVLPILVPYQSTEQQMLLSRLSLLPPLAIFFEWLPFRFPFSLA